MTFMNHDRDAAATRKRLLDAAEGLLSEVGFRCISEPKICEAAKLSRGGLRHHFPNGCYDIIAALTEELFHKLPPVQANASVKQRVLQLLNFIADFPERNPAVLLMEIWVASRTDEKLEQAVSPSFELHQRYLLNIPPGKKMSPEDLPYRFILHGALLYFYSGHNAQKNIKTLVNKLNLWP